MTRSERGMIAGAEALAMGTLVLIVGMLLVTNAWSVIDTRMALESATREYLRAYTEADSPEEARQDAAAALAAVLADRPALADRVSVAAPPAATFGPCAAAAVTVSATVPAIHMPLVRGWGQHAVTVSAVELIDAHQEMITGPAYDPLATACHG